MGRVHLVRHGQASLGSEDYDRLSERGAQQCRALGEFWHARSHRFGAVMRGSLKRHRQSLEAVSSALPNLPEATVWPTLDEYDSEALIASVTTASAVGVHDEESVRRHFRWLREALVAWIAGRTNPEGMPSFAEFSAGVSEALRHAHTVARDADVLVISSGGPISTALMQVLGAPPERLIALNMRMRNSAISTLVSTASGFELEGYNALPHLDGARAALITHA
jgi:broad specificity phosphatase PhoE